jgi:hypothetical protein
MQALVDIVNSVTSSVRFIFLLFFITIIAIGLFLTVGASVVAPQAADAIAERAERVGDRAIAAAQEESRNRALASDGWGFEEPAAGSGATYTDEGEAKGGWGE